MSAIFMLDVLSQAMSELLLRGLWTELLFTEEALLSSRTSGVTAKKGPILMEGDPGSISFLSEPGWSLKSLHHQSDGRSKSLQGHLLLH